MSRTYWRLARPLGGVTILAVLVWRVGSGPFLDGVRMVDAWSLLAATGIAVVTTLCCAWRWSIVARGLGAAVPMRVAVAAYYRSQFLNTTLPGGVLGDVDRGVRHGRLVGDTGRGLRAVAWERLAGQVVQVTLAIAVLVVLPSPWRWTMPGLAALVVALGLGTILLGRRIPRGGPSLWARTVRTAASDLRTGLLAPHAWPRILLASTGAVTGHAVTFLVAAHTAGTTASPLTMLPLTMLVLLAMSVPTNIAGWGPREGVAAWAFAAAGLGAAQGIAAAVVYGVMVFVASLPGAVVLVVSWLRRHQGVQPATRRQAVLEGAGHG